MNSKAGKWLPSRKDGVSMETELWVPIQFSNSGISGKKESTTTEEVFTYVEEMPRFVGCEHLAGHDRIVCSTRAIMNYFSERVIYPAIDREKGIEGMVIAQFTVNPDGTLSDITILRSPSESMQNEVLRVVNSMNEHPLKWIPGRHLNRPVPVKFTLPFKFVLQDVVSKESKKTNVPGIVQGKTPVSQDDDFTLYPNPVSTLLNVEIFDGAQTVNVFDMHGKLFLTKPLTPVDKGSVILNVSELINGSYLVQVISPSQTTTMKFIVNH
jgi:TonB family protein